MSLYRTYRPKTLADVIGQDHIVGTLEKSLEQDRLSHAYLFSGPRGTGKTSVARILAKALLTHGTDEARKNQLLKGIEENSLVDLVEIDAASNRRIDDVRSLLEGIVFPPVAAAAKVYIVDEVHMLTKEAFNALLKTLEEPPPYAFFILATTELHKVPPTIQSRCQRFQFRQIREEDIIRRLQTVADAEKIDIDRPALRAVAAIARGGMRDALSLLDQLRSLPAIRENDVAERIGESGHAQAAALLGAVEAGDSTAILQLTAELEKLAVPPENVLRIILETLRESLPAALPEPAAAARAMAKLDAILWCLRELRTSPAPMVALEAGLLRAAGFGGGPITAAAPMASTPVATPPPPAPSAPAPTSIKKAAPAPVAEAPALTPTPTPAPAVSAEFEAPALDLESLKKAWAGIAAKVEPSSARMSLKDARVTGIEGKTITLTFGSRFHRDKSATGEGSRSLEALLQDAFKVPLRANFVVDGAGTGQAEREVVNVAAMAAEIF
ncbi:MAG: DNA polymerase III subunit gamma/tau [Candidatus Peribacteraceae bacterium]|nr:DNA polymerase III subunit gamma/tau [Candidatus Peribacteraceae bacterium]